MKRVKVDIRQFFNMKIFLYLEFGNLIRKHFGRNAYGSTLVELSKY
jgi:hypothetical protein